MPEPLKDFLKRWAITTLGVLVAAHIVKGIHYDQWQGLLVATLLLGFLNAFVRPLLLLLSLPLLVVTLGMFTFVINATLLYGVGQLVKTFHVDSFGAAFWGGLVISVISMPLNFLAGVGGARIEVRSRKTPDRKPPPRDDDGPVIDV